MHQVVHVQVVAQRVLPRKRVVVQSNGRDQLQPGVPSPGIQFRRTNEFAVLVRTGREQLQDVLRADDGKDERLRVAVDGREEHVTAGLDESAA